MPAKKNKKHPIGISHNFIYFLIFSFLIVASSALIAKPFSGNLVEKQNEKIVDSGANKPGSPPKPVIVSSPTPLLLSAHSVLAVDVDSGITLYEKNPDLKLLPASTTKIITSLVAMDYYPLDKVLRVRKMSVDGQKMHLIPGEEITTEDLLYGLLVFSANDAAEVLAENYPGGRDVFIAAMNLKAKELGLDNTSFTNPAGFDGKDHMTTARDLNNAALYAMQNPLFAEIVSTKEKDVKSVNGKITHKLVNLNELIGDVGGVLGVKTGWTENARENLVTYIERGDRKIMISLLGSRDRFEETKAIIDWVFKNYNWESVDL